MDIESQALNRIAQTVTQGPNDYVQTQQAAWMLADRLFGGAGSHLMGIWRIPPHVREGWAYAACHDIATTYGEALRANLEDAANIARIAGSGKARRSSEERVIHQTLTTCCRR